MRKGKVRAGCLQQTRVSSVLVQHLFVHPHEKARGCLGAVNSEQLGPYQVALESGGTAVVKSGQEKFHKEMGCGPLKNRVIKYKV